VTSSMMATTSRLPTKGFSARTSCNMRFRVHAVFFGQLRTRRSTTSGRQHVCHGTVDTVRCDGLRTSFENSRLVILAATSS
jgi:hypothetical protein